MMTERPHRKLVLWQKAMDFVTDVYRLGQSFPASERFGIVSQIQRAAVSVPSNIAEGAARRTRKDYVHFLYTARGSLSELDTQFEIATRLGYLDSLRYSKVQEQTEELSRMLNALIASLSR